MTPDRARPASRRTTRRGRGRALETVAAPTPSAAALEPDIQVSPNAIGCRSTSLTGQRLSASEYLVVTEPGAIVRVDWSVDGETLGTATDAPFVPRDASELLCRCR